MRGREAENILDILDKYKKRDDKLALVEKKRRNAYGYENDLPPRHAASDNDDGITSLAPDGDEIAIESTFDTSPRQTREDYGRILPEEVLHKNQKHFKTTLPENPYRVVMAQYTLSPSREFPDQPILQFWTWFRTLHLVPPEEPSKSIPEGLVRYDVADDMGDWCGTIVMDEQWINCGGLKSSADGTAKHDFIAISDAKAFTEEECEVWTFYVPKDREQSEWDLYNVMLLERDGFMWRRVAMGKVFKGAFAGSEWKEIVLG